MRGVCEAGLSTTGQPAAIAGATLCATRLSGKLNGLIAADHADREAQREGELAVPGAVASIGTISPVSVRASTAAKRNVATARAASTRAVLIGLPASAQMICAASSWRSSSRRGDLVEDRCPAMRGQRALECVRGRVEPPPGLCCAALGDAADALARVRRQDVEPVARGHRRAADRQRPVAERRDVIPSQLELLSSCAYQFSASVRAACSHEGEAFATKGAQQKTSATWRPATNRSS